MALFCPLLNSLTFEMISRIFFLVKTSFGLSFEDQRGRSLALSASQTKTKSFVDETALTFKPLPSLPLTQKAEGFPYCISVSLGLTKKIYNANAHWVKTAAISKRSGMALGEMEKS